MLRNFFTEPLAPDEELFSAPKPRTRTDDALQPIKTYRSYWWNTSGPPPAEPEKESMVLRGTHRTMTDLVIPRFKERSAAGETFNNPMSYDTAKLVVNAEEGCAFQKTVNNITYHGDITGPWLSTTPKTLDSIRAYVISTTDGTLGLNPDRAGLIALASTEARARIKPADFAGLVSLGEMKETLRYLLNPFQGGMVLASKLERQVGQRFATSRGDQASALAGLYLGFRYGLRPLVREVENALETLQNVGLKPLRQTFRAKAYETVSGTQITLGMNTGGITCNETVLGKRTLTVRCGFLTENYFDNGLTDRWGLRLSDIPQSLWELIPLSFLVDWVLNVRSFIGALTPRLGFRTLAGWTTIRDQRQVILSGRDYRFSDWSTVRSGPNEIAMDVTSVTRQPSVNSPMLEFRGFDNLANDVGRLFDLTGIFGQRLNKFAQHEHQLNLRRDLSAESANLQTILRNRKFNSSFFLPR